MASLSALQGYTSQNKNVNVDLVNQTLVLEFVLTGFPGNLHMRILQFIVFLSIYILSVLGNRFLIFTVIASPPLHIAMYYFLCYLSFIDLFFTSHSMPKLLLDVFSKLRKISYFGCLIQMYVGLFLGCGECILLAVMAYDRYVAICLPLYYTTIMNWRVCRYCSVMILLGSFFLCTVPNILKPFVFCKGNRMNHFACEILGLLELVCGDISAYKLQIFFIGLFILFLPLVFIVVSYICIIISILKIKSADNRLKTFSTCSSHLTVVFIFYVTSMIAYMGRGIRLSSKYFFLIYAVVTPLLNPLIYSLRNNEVKKAFSKILEKRSVSSST